MRLVGGPAEAPPADTSVPPWFRRRWVYFADQWDPKSPWHDRRGASPPTTPAIVTPSTRQRAEGIPGSPAVSSRPPSISTGGRLSPPTIQPERRSFWPRPGIPTGSTRVSTSVMRFSSLAESVITYLKAAGIQAKLRPLERAAFFKGTPRRSSRTSSREPAAPSAMRPRALRPSWPRAGPMSTAAMTTSTDSSENRRRRWTPRGGARPCGTSSSSFTRRRCSRRSGKIGGLSGVGLRVEDSGRGHIAGYPFSAPYEDVKLKAK